MAPRYQAEVLLPDGVRESVSQDLALSPEANASLLAAPVLNWFEQRLDDLRFRCLSIRALVESGALTEWRSEVQRSLELLEKQESKKVPPGSSLPERLSGLIEKEGQLEMYRNFGSHLRDDAIARAFVVEVLRSDEFDDLWNW